MFNMNGSQNTEFSCQNMVGNMMNLNSIITCYQ